MTLHIRNFTADPQTVDLAAGTVEAVIATGADVARAGFIERLDLAGVDLGRAAAGKLPVLDGHRAGSTRDVLGTVASVERRPEGLVAVLRIDSAAVLERIRAGTLRNISIGYTVGEWRDLREGGRRIRVAAKWELLEVSIVPVPADPGAHFRNLEETSMENDDDVMTAPPPDDQVQIRAEANREIRSIADTAGLTRDWADAQIDRGASAEEARAAAFEAMQTRQRETRVRATGASAGHSFDDPAIYTRAMGEALYAATNPGHEPSPQARQFVGMGAVDLARECLRRSGASPTGLSPEGIITRATSGYMGTSDFPLVLADTMGRNLRRSYEAAPAPILALARPRLHRDFRAISSVQVGPAPALREVPEHGEFEHGGMSEARESCRLATFGTITGLTRQALVNDDLGALATITPKMGASARATEAQLLADLVNGNPAMADAAAVFHSDHGNTANATSGGDTAEDDFILDLGKARLAMRAQTGLDGEIIDVAPRFVVVPPALETIAEKALAKITAAKVADANPFSALELIVEPRLTSSSRWYVVADPARIDGLEIAHLAGAPGPQIETRVGWEVDGVQFKVRLDVGAGWLDWRGWQRVGV